MVPIVICDDETAVLDLLKDTINECIKEEHMTFFIDCVTDKPGSVINYIDTHPQESTLFLLDVELDSSSYTGISLGFKIRKVNPNSYLIYVSCHTEAAILTFKHGLRCFDFITKDDEKLKKRLKQDLILIQKDIQECPLSDKLMEYHNQIIDMRKLLYIEASKNHHKIRFVSEGSISDVYGTLSDIHEKLPDYFFPCHRSIIVNLNKISYISKEDRKIIFSNNEECYGSAAQLCKLKKIKPSLFVSR